MEYIIKLRVPRSELPEAIQELLGNGWNICSLTVADEITMRTLFLPISAQSASKQPLQTAKLVASSVRRAGRANGRCGVPVRPTRNGGIPSWPSEASDSASDHAS
jgi:hypothetical protein